MSTAEKIRRAYRILALIQALCLIAMVVLLAIATFLWFQDQVAFLSVAIVAGCLCLSTIAWRRTS